MHQVMITAAWSPRYAAAVQFWGCFRSFCLMLCLHSACLFLILWDVSSAFEAESFLQWMLWNLGFDRGSRLRASTSG